MISLNAKPGKKVHIWLWQASGTHFQHSTGRLLCMKEEQDKLRVTGEGRAWNVRVIGKRQIYL